jgi:hypothetical protein
LIAAWYVGISYFVARQYQDCICRDPKSPTFSAEECKNTVDLSGWFFAGQTITTTGYGAGGVNLDNTCVKKLACWVMPVGSSLWALAIGVLLAIGTKTDT